MTDWTKVVQDAETQAENQRQEQDSRNAEAREREAKRRSEISKVMREIVLPVLRSAEAALMQSGHVYKMEPLTYPGGDPAPTQIRGFAFRVGKVKSLAASQPEESLTSTFTIEDVDVLRKIQFHAHHRGISRRGPHETVEPADMTTAWVEERLARFIENAFAA